ncbi:hypothetical protein SPBR_03875 [Sporothrix brasiliensis 5110]|uniref:Uncharacterized protein n=1 Tax=Sporothrix brasiliensis 5110 TaxID=1398154 RepID=A0A0C2J7D8_9PEZI|nr:uncharacterized protein SPBR_03875 [Sporothrix brasiliensis 5110]KIH94910.1 hypothetical protein SPBR_03875 [Sporothrix brasiliensis 5110]
MYLCGYYASIVYLHRVAYATLPATEEVLLALAEIWHLAIHSVELDPGAALPADMVWPLLMLGSEENTRLRIKSLTYPSRCEDVRQFLASFQASKSFT